MPSEVKQATASVCRLSLPESEQTLFRFCFCSIRAHLCAHFRKMPVLFGSCLACVGAVVFRKLQTSENASLQHIGLQLLGAFEEQQQGTATQGLLPRESTFLQVDLGYKDPLFGPPLLHFNLLSPFVLDRLSGRATWQQPKMRSVPSGPGASYVILSQITQ